MNRGEGGADAADAAAAAVGAAAGAADAAADAAAAVGAIAADTTPSWLTVITGHYGVGKTNLSLNLVRDLRAVAPRVTLVDLDIVNPYFRSTDNKAFLDACDIELLGPVHGASNLDTPSLSPGIDEAIRTAGPERVTLIDVGGDSDGARALGRYSAEIMARPHRVVFVVNLSRPETASAEDNLELLRRIEETSGLAVTELFGNT
ncbi:MAG: hypothetical protein LBH64_02580, partial [Coriobacteriales bacterium]|nr:hypothetical protein [Coriobacteriales bacterium]